MHLYTHIWITTLASGIGYVHCNPLLQDSFAEERLRVKVARDADDTTKMIFKKYLKITTQDDDIL